MRLTMTLAASAIAGSTAPTGGLAGCGGTNTDLQGGETDCDAGDSTHDQNHEPVDPADNT